MSGIIRWEAPPPRRTSDVYDWDAIADTLRAKPGEWALIVVCPNTATAGSTARHIRNGQYEALWSGFDAVARTIDNEARVYARYIGGRCPVSGLVQPWRWSHRADPRALPLADRHYNRQKPGAPRFVPPGRCAVFLTDNANALWVTSWPLAEYVQHDWAGAMVNSLFRREDGPLASDLIVAATAATHAHWPDLPPLGIVSFVDAKKTRRKRDPGRCYRKAGWTHVGFTKAGLWVYQLLPDEFPEPLPARPRYSANSTLLDLLEAS